MCQVVIDYAISGYVSVELMAPPVRIVLWRCPMYRTAVPKASVDEDGNLRASKNDVSPSTLSWWSNVNSVSETSFKKFMSQRSLGCSVTRPLPLKAKSNSVTQRLRLFGVCHDFVRAAATDLAIR
jgi:hypothetical protein